MSETLREQRLSKMLGETSYLKEAAAVQMTQKELKKLQGIMNKFQKNFADPTKIPAADMEKAINAAASIPAFAGSKVGKKLIDQMNGFLSSLKQGAQNQNQNQNQEQSQNQEQPQGQNDANTSGEQPTADANAQDNGQVQTTDQTQSDDQNVDQNADQSTQGDDANASGNNPVKPEDLKKNLASMFPNVTDDQVNQVLSILQPQQQ